MRTLNIEIKLEKLTALKSLVSLCCATHEAINISVMRSIQPGGEVEEYDSRIMSSEYDNNK